MLKKDDINEEFWKRFGVHYDKECFTDAIRDACFYIVQLVQEKSELEDFDGEKLITNAFSESSPKLLINQNQSQTEKDEQRGFGFLLRGIICAIRNPISHNSDYKFTEEEADGILIFMNNYVLPKLDNSKDFTYVDNWFQFIFEDNDDDSENFSDIILSNIPKKEKLDLMITIVNELEFIKQEKYKYIINKLYEELNQKDKIAVINLLNQKLIKAGDDNYLRAFFNHFDPRMWEKLDPLVKARIEGIVEKAVKGGKTFFHPVKMKKTIKGSIATWAEKWIVHFDNRKQIINLLYEKMNIEDEADYVITYFMNIVGDENNIIEYKNEVIDGLKNGKKQYKDFLDMRKLLNGSNNELEKDIKQAYESFKQKNVEKLPF